MDQPSRVAWVICSVQRNATQLRTHSVTCGDKRRDWLIQAPKEEDSGRGTRLVCGYRGVGVRVTFAGPHGVRGNFPPLQGLRHPRSRPAWCNWHPGVSGSRGAVLAPRPPFWRNRMAIPLRAPPQSHQGLCGHGFPVRRSLHLGRPPPRPLRGCSLEPRPANPVPTSPSRRLLPEILF